MKAPKTLIAILVGAALAFGPAMAQNNPQNDTTDSKAKSTVKKGAHKTGHAAKEGGEAVGKGAKKGGKAVVKGTKKAGKAVGNTAEKGYEKTKDAVK